MTAPPRAAGLDESAALLREGYAFVGNRCRRLGTDLFETRLLGQRTICMLGAENARVFYDTERMQRAGAMPAVVKQTLIGPGGVLGLDGEAHRQRKAMLMALMTRERIDALAGLVAEQLRGAAQQWQRMDRITLLDDLRTPLFKAVCAWTGVPLADHEAEDRGRDMAALFTGSANVGWRQLRAWQARRRSDAWAANLVEQVRDGRLPVAADLPLARIADHREPNGERLHPETAAVELLNLLRPTVAVSVYMVFAALALHEHPEARDEVANGGEPELHRFVLEVRRYYPFFPFVAALVREPFLWRGYQFAQGRRVLLDLFGTDRDPRSWEAPDKFLPARFLGVEPDAFELIPQGGGDHHRNHRCAGEWITLDLMKAAVRFLLRDVVYEVPDQDLRVPLNRLPTTPNSGFVITRLRPVAA